MVSVRFQQCEKWTDATIACIKPAIDITYLHAERVPFLAVATPPGRLEQRGDRPGARNADPSKQHANPRADDPVKAQKTYTLF